MPFVPIILPVQSKTKECIIVDGHSYCKQSDITDSALGVAILIAIGFALWVFFLVWVSEKLDHFWPIPVGLLVPLVILAIALILK